MGEANVSQDSAEREALALLDELCRLPSVSAEERALSETAEVVERMLQEGGFATRQLRVEGAPPVVYGEQPGRSSYTLLLYNHYDVQPSDPIESWESPPFEPTLRDGRLYARGTGDNKGELAVRLAVLRHLRTRDGELPCGISFWEGAPVALADERPLVSLGYKGMLVVRLDIETMRADAHSATAAVLPSAAWKLIDALASIRGADGHVRIPGFYDRVREPSPEARRAVAEQGSGIEDEIRAARGVESFLDGIRGTSFNERFAFASTCNIAGITSGYAGPGMKTVLPARASALIDFRLVPDQDPDSILHALRSHLEENGHGDVEVTELAAAQPVVTSLDHPLARRVITAAEAFAGVRPAITPIAPSSLPLLDGLRRQVGLPGLSAPTNPSYFGSNNHAPNEHIRLDHFSRAIGMTRALVEALGGTSRASSSDIPARSGKSVLPPCALQQAREFARSGQDRHELAEIQGRRTSIRRPVGARLLRRRP